METTEIKIRTCPICGAAYSGHPAISRIDNETLFIVIVKQGSHWKVSELMRRNGKDP